MSLETVREVLQFYIDIGVDEIVGTTPVNRYQAGAPEMRLHPPAASPRPRPDATSERPGHQRLRDNRPPAPDGGKADLPARLTTEYADTRALAAACSTLDELENAIRAFKGLAITRTATNTVFADGNPKTDLMFVGEAPGNEEDRQGKPFVGPAGKLLDRMLAAIGRDRSSVYISNILNWRPPGNRTPTPEEAHACLPFVHRHIQLINPAIVVLLGGTAAKHLLQTSQGIMRLRGKWGVIPLDPDGGSQVRALPTLHPAYLLRTPAAKKMAWADFLKLQEALAPTVRENSENSS